MSDMAATLALWSELTGLDKKVKTLGDWRIQQISQDIQEALDLDGDGLTAYMMLNYFAKRYFHERTFTVHQMLTDYDGMLSYLAKAEKLKELLAAADIVEAADAFEAKVIQGLGQYGANREDVLKLARDRDSLAFLRRDALRGVEKLRIYQFTQGEPGAVHPKFFDRILVAFSPNALIELAATVMPDGVALAMIQDPGYYHSFFVFVIRNGGTISVLTDRPEFAHPMQRQMIRRPDRMLENRAFAHHFPYDLLGMKWDEEGNLYFETGKGTAAVPFQKEFAYSKFIKDCHPDEVIWISLMLDRIADKFYKKNFKTPELAYTGEMITDKGRLLAAAKTANLPVVGYRETKLERLTAADVRHDSDLVATAGLRKESTNVHLWMEERYADAVLDDVLNVAKGPEEKTLYITAGSTAVEEFSGNHDPVHSWNRKGDLVRYNLQALDLTGFGTEAEIRQDQVFIGRANAATMIQRAADREYEARKDEVLKWFEKRVRKNLPNLLKAIGEGTLEAPTFHDWLNALAGKPAEDPVRGGPIWCNRRTILNVIDLEQKGLRYEQKYVDGVRLHQEWDHRRGALCIQNGTKATYLAKFTPRSPQALALLAGCEVKDLPDVLQHWYSKHDSSNTTSGNYILDRLDPMDWHLKNPWSRLSLDVGVYLSYRAFSKLCKDADRPVSTTYPWR